MNGQSLNPYVGPRPLERGDTLYGRDHELGELLDLLVSERIVMLHSPSGAGKSSLIHAGLMPELDFSAEDDEFDDEDGFQVVGPLRVNAEIPESDELAGVEVNRFVLSLMLSAEEARPKENRRPLADLAATSLRDYLRQLHKEEGNGLPQLLIIDQFEDVLTKDSTNLAAKRAFFAQLGQALRAKDRFALLAIREDYLAALAPYTPRVPTGLQNTYRLDLLGQRGAEEAIRGPAAEDPFKTRYADEAVQRLLSDLRQVTVMGPDGTPIQTMGPHVEPVQLQVVCHRLFEELPEGTEIIEAERLEDLGNVDQALGAYYAAVVTRAAGGQHTTERAVRDWVETNLITEGGMRGQVMRVSEERQGISHACLDVLVDAHLVRGESRRGATWYELAHDRLVAPVKADNEAWRQQNLGALQLQAEMWRRRGEPEGLLLSPEALAEAEQWAADQGELAEVEEEFLESSRRRADELNREAEREEAARREKELAQAQELAASRKKAARFLQAGLVVAVVLLAVAGWFYYMAEQKRGEAETAKKKADEMRDAAEEAGTRATTRLERMLTLSANHLQDDPLLGTLLLSEIVRDEAMKKLGDREPHGGRSAALQLSGALVPRAWLRGHTAPLTGAVFSPDGMKVATSSDDGTARIWSADGRGNPKVLSGHGGKVYSAAFNSDGTMLVTRGADSTVRTWTADGKALAVIKTTDLGWVKKAHFSGDAVVITTDSGEHRWSATDGGALPPGPAVIVRESQIPFSMADRSLPSVQPPTLITYKLTGDAGRAVGLYSDNVARLWAGIESQCKKTLPGPWCQRAQRVPMPMRGHNGKLVSLALSDDGRWAVIASHDGTASVWPITLPAQRVANLISAGPPVLDIVLSGDGQLLAHAGADGEATLLDLENGRTLGKGKHDHDVIVVRFNRAAGQLASLDYSGAARLWNLSGELTRELIVPGDVVQFLDLSSDGQSVTTACQDGSARIWPVTPQGDPLILTGHKQQVHRARFSPDGGQVVTASEDRTAMVWDAASGKLLHTLKGHYTTVLDARFSPDGKRVLTASADHTARLWDAATGSLIATLKGHSQILTVARFSPNGSHLLTASTDGKAILWSAAGKPKQTFSDHPAAVIQARFSPDGEWVVTASADLAYLRKTSGKEPAIVLAGHGEKVSDLAFTPDGKGLITSGFDGRVRRWDLSASWTGLMKELDGRTTICLTPFQRVTYLAEDEPTAEKKFKKCEGAYGRRGRLQQVRRTRGHQVQITLELQPAGARATVDGKVVSGNLVKLDLSDKTHSLVVSMAGYASETRTLRATTNQTISVTLKKRAARPAAAPAATDSPEPPPTASAPKPAAKPKAKAKAKKPAAKPAAKAKKPSKAVYFEDEL